MEGEFEVQIRDGDILTAEGRETLRKLSKEFDLFQFEPQINKILNAYTALTGGKSVSL